MEKEVLSNSPFWNDRAVSAAADVCYEVANKSPVSTNFTLMSKSVSDLVAYYESQSRVVFRVRSIGAKPFDQNKSFVRFKTIRILQTGSGWIEVLK
jgi:hypothetical protein